MKRLRQISSVKVVALGFAALILTGALLLSLPVSAANGKSTDFTDALFTSASAVCVTGLSVLNTGLYWSPFGKTVILLLIQTGGLGFMAIAALVSFAFRRKISLKERIIMADALNRDELSGIVRLMHSVILLTFLFEGIGAIVLSSRFIPEYGFWQGIAKGIFHSVSAFCNAGFDTFGGTGDLNSLTKYVSDSVVNITLMLLITFGGLGFFVFVDIAHRRHNRKLHTQTKLVLLVSAILLFCGALLIFAFEYNNKNTIGNMPLGDKITASFFQSVTCRTAGFETIPQNSFTMPSKLISMLLMFIGGSPGSTAGGIKTVTAAVLVLSAVSVISGNDNTNAFKRRIKSTVIKKAFAIVMLSFGVLFVSVVAICCAENISFDKIVFEVVSAFGTVGLSCGITGDLSFFSKFILIFLMYFGRIGILTIGMAVVQRSDKSVSLYKYADAHISVG